MQAYAIAITEENLNGVIHSEAGWSYNLEAALQWLEEHEEGWFLRDPGSAFDCAFFESEVFGQIYTFLHSDAGSLIRPVIRI